MKGKKKFISLLLMVALLLSSSSLMIATLAADAQEGSIASQEVVKKITDFTGKVAATAPEEDIAAFKEVMLAYKGLSNDDKNKMSIEATGKLFKLAYDYHYARETTGSSVEKRIAANAQAGEALARTAEQNGAITWWDQALLVKATTKAYASAKVTIEEPVIRFTDNHFIFNYEVGGGNASALLDTVVQTYKGLDEYTKKFMALVSLTYMTGATPTIYFGADMTREPYVYITKIADVLINKDYAKIKYDISQLPEPPVTDPPTPATPTPLKNMTDPTKAWAKLVEIDPAAKSISETLTPMLPGIEVSRKEEVLSQEILDGLGVAIKSYDSLDSVIQLYISRSAVPFTLLSVKGDVTAKEQIQIKNMNNEAIGAYSTPIIERFSLLINKMTTPYDQKDVEEAKKLFGSLPTVAHNNVLDADKATFAVILNDEFVRTINGITNDGSEENPYTVKDYHTVRDAYKKHYQFPGILPEKSLEEEIVTRLKEIVTTFKADSEAPILPENYKKDGVYPVGGSKRRVTELVAMLDPMIVGLIGGLGGAEGATVETLLETSLYTSATVASLAQMIYPLLFGLLKDSIAGKLIFLFPSVLSNNLTEDRFAAACELLDAVDPTPPGNASDFALVEASMATWANLKPEDFKSGAFGFDNGDAEGFIKALASVLRPVMSFIENGVLGMGKVDFRNTIEDHQINYGVYECLIPILEALDIKNIMSSTEYGQAYLDYEAVDEKDKGKTDSLIIPIFTPIFGLIDDLGKAPLATILNLVPKLGTLLATQDSGKSLLQEQITKMIKPLGMIGDMIGGIELDSNAIVSLVQGLLGGIEIAPGVSLAYTLLPINWDNLARNASPVAKDSVTREATQRLGFETDQIDTFLTVFRYLYNTLTDTGDVATFAAAGSNLDITTGLVKTLLAGAGLGEGIDALLIDILTNNTADEALVLIMDLLGIEPDPTPEPGHDPKPILTPVNVDVPSTGDSDNFAILFCMAISACAILFVITRKRKENV